MTTPILEARDLSKLFPGPKKLFTPARFVTAVDRVSLAVMPGETLAIVGESGSGKSTLGRLLLRLLAASEGRVFYQGEGDHPRLGRAPQSAPPRAADHLSGSLRLPEPAHDGGADRRRAAVAAPEHEESGPPVPRCRAA